MCFLSLTRTWQAALLLAGLLGGPAARAQQPADAAAAQKAAAEARHQHEDDMLRNDWPNLGKYTAANQRLPAPQPGRPRVVIIGNSITEGWVKEDSAFFRGKTYEYVGRGISGQGTGQTLLRFRADVIDLRPAVVVLLVGTNDVAENNGPYRPQTTLNNIMSMCELARAHGIRVVLGAVAPSTEFGWRKGLNPAPKILALNERLKAYAAQQHFAYYDLHSALKDDQNGLSKAYGEDGVHPNLAGYRIMEHILNQTVARTLKDK